MTEHNLLNMDEYTLLNMVYDLIAQNPIKGCYDFDHDDLTAMVTCVDETTNSIEFIDEINKRTFNLTLRHTHTFI